MSDDLEKLQGVWAVRSLEVEGQPMPESMIDGAQIIIKGKRFTSTGMGATYEGTLKINPSTRPPQLDLKFDAGPEKGNTNFGIYKFDGENWKLCLATRGDIRPSKFASTPGSGFALEILTRGSAVRAAKRQKTTPTKSVGPATEFEGDWQMVSGVMDGAAMKPSDVQWVRRVMTGNETKVTAGPQTMLQATFTHDPSKSPKTIDYVITAGANKGKSQLGIYEFEGDLLRICMAAPGQARAMSFESKKGDGRTFTAWKRA
jgi:uncharacterized protein (TIGR03067 family)